MRRMIPIILLCVGLVLAGAASAAPQAPLTVVFRTKDAGQSGSLEIAAAFASLLSQTGRVQAWVYDARDPSIQRLVLEKQLASGDAPDNPNPRQQSAIAKAMQARYIGVVSARWERDAPTTPKAPRGARKTDLAAVAQDVIRADIEWREATGGGAWKQTVRTAPVAVAVGANASPRVDATSTIRAAAAELVNALTSGPLAGLPVLMQPDDTPAERPSSPAPGSTTGAPSTTGALLVSIAATEQAKEAYESGERAMQAKDFATAIDLFRRAADLDPFSAAPRRKLVESYLARGMDEEAVAEAERAALLVTDVTAISDALAEAYVTSGRFDAAEKLFLKLAESQPENPDAWMKLGDLQWNAGKLDAAERYFAKAAELAPGRYEPQLRLARLALLRGRPDLARQPLSVVAQLIPRDEEALRAYVFRAVAQDMVSAIDRIRSRTMEATGSRARGQITREALFRTLKDSTADVASLHALLDMLQPLPPQMDAREGLALALRLAEQAVSRLQVYLETDDTNAKDEAELALMEAVREAGAAVKTLGPAAGPTR